MQDPFGHYNILQLYANCGASASLTSLFSHLFYFGDLVSGLGLYKSVPINLYLINCMHDCSECQ